MAASAKVNSNILSGIVAMPVIKSAVAKGFIHPRDIARALPARLTKRPRELKATVSSLATILGALGVVIVIDKPAEPGRTASKAPEGGRRKSSPCRKHQIASPHTGTGSIGSPEIDDETILRQVHHHPEVFTVLDTRWRKPFHRCAAGVLHDWMEAEDVVQEAFLKMYRYADTFESRGSEQKFSSWAYRIVLNTAYTRYRKLKDWRRFAVWPQEDEDGRPIADENSPGLAAKSRELWKEAEEQADSKIIVVRLLSQLPEDMRSLFTAYYLDGLTYEEISGKMGISNEAIKMRLFRARRHCQRLLNEGNGEAVGEKAIEEMLEDGATLEAALPRFTPAQTMQANKELGEACHRLRMVLSAVKFSSLSQRNVEIFATRYGLDGSYQIKTYEAVGNRHGTTAEQVRQVVDNGVWPKLRELGVKQDDEWLRGEVHRIRLLRGLIGKTADSVGA